jgi:hypothetical protein
LAGPIRNSRAAEFVKEARVSTSSWIVIFHPSGQKC